MKVMAESFSDAGVPVFMCDVKGDVAGICAPGQSTEDMEKRIDRFGLRETFTYREYPTTFWDIYQEDGHPIRVTVSEMGPELLSRILGLTDVQEGILHIVFRIADDKGLLLIDLKDLRVMLNYVNEHRSEYMMTYGNITPQSVAAILRVLLQKIEQTVKLIRSRGVGVYFVTQSPSDIPDTVLAQLSNRVQHALRAYTPAELKAVRTAAQTFRANPEFRTEDAILELGVGEALTSFLDEEGVPTVVERTKIICPQSSMAPPDPMFRSKAMLHDGMEKYDDSVDNESAYEVLTAEAVKAEVAAEEEADRKIREKEEAAAEKQRLKEEEAAKKRLQKLEDEERRRRQKLEDQALRKKERQQEKAEADARRRADRIEAELLAVGASVLTRGLLGVLQNQSKK